MKKLGNKLTAKAITKIAVVLIAASLMSLFGLPGSAVTYTWPENGKKEEILYYKTGGNKDEVGSITDTFAVNTTSLTVRCTSRTLAENASLIKNGSTQVDLWYLSGKGYNVLIAEGIDNKGTVQDDGTKLYKTSGYGSYNKSDIYIINYGIRLSATFSHYLKMTNGNNVSQDRCVTAMMSSLTGTPTFAEPGK